MNQSKIQHLIAIANGPDKDSFDAAVKGAGCWISTDIDFFFFFWYVNVWKVFVSFTLWYLLSSGEEDNKRLPRLKQIYQKQSIRPTVG